MRAVEEKSGREGGRERGQTLAREYCINQGEVGYPRTFVSQHKQCYPMIQRSKRWTYGRHLPPTKLYRSSG